MNSRVSRLLLAIAAAIFAFGGIMHAVAYVAKALPGISRSNLPAFFGAELQVLWLADSTTLVTIALVFGFLAARPYSASKSVIMLLSGVPAATAALLYLFLGPFYAGHMLLAASAMVFVAGLIMPAPNAAGEFVGPGQNAAHEAPR